MHEKNTMLLTEAFGISVFTQPEKNKSFHNALLNSLCDSRALAIPLVASTPNVLPSKFK